MEKKEKTQIEFPNVYIVPNNRYFNIRSEIKIPEGLARLIDEGHAKDKIQRLIRKGLKGLELHVIEDENEQWYSVLTFPTGLVLSLKATIDNCMAVHQLHHNILDVIVDSYKTGNIITDLKPFVRMLND